MRILYVDETYPPDRRGCVPYVVDLVKYLRGRGDTADVLTIGENTHPVVEREANGAIYRMSANMEFDSARLSSRLLGFMAQHLDEYDICHLCHPNPAGEGAYLLGRALGRCRHVKSAIIFHAEVVSIKRFANLYNQLVTRRIVNAVDRVVVSSPKLAASVKCLSDVYSKLQVIPFGVDLELWRQRARDGVLPQQVAQDKTQPHWLFVGRLVRYKGVENLIEAMRTAPGTLYIVGDGPMRAELEQRRQQAGLADRVHLLGRLDDNTLAAMYAWADALILPSVDRGEAFGYVLTEAMTQSTALISTELGTGTSWINQDGETGYVVPPGQPQALADAMQRLAADPDTLGWFKAAAYQRVATTFTLTHMLESTSQLYQSMLPQPPAP